MPTYIGSPAGQYRLMAPPPSICIEWGRGVCGGFSLPVRLSSPANATPPYIATQPPPLSLRFITPYGALFQAQLPSFYSCISPLLANESEKFFTPCKLLAYGEMNTTLAGGLRNILREDLVYI